MDKAKLITGMLEEFQKIVLSNRVKVLIPILPLFIGFTFCSLAYEGSITKQLPVFLKVIIIVMIGHYIWMALLYTIWPAVYSGKNPLEVVKHYGPAYLTAVGTMSSAATLGVALQCAGKAKPLRKDMVQFGIPLFANIHLCGSVLTEVFFCMNNLTDSVWKTSVNSNNASVLYTSWSVCNRCTGSSRRNSYGIPWTYHRSPSV